MTIVIWYNTEDADTTEQNVMIIGAISFYFRIDEYQFGIIKQTDW